MNLPLSRARSLCNKHCIPAWITASDCSTLLCLSWLIKYLLFLTCPYQSTQDKGLVFEDAVKDFNLVFSAVKTGRSLAASYSLQCKHPAGSPSLYHRYLKVSSVRSGSIGPLFESQAFMIVTLIKGCKSLKVVRDISGCPCWMWLGVPYTHCGNTHPRAGQLLSISFAPSTQTLLGSHRFQGRNCEM